MSPSKSEGWGYAGALSVISETAWKEFIVVSSLEGPILNNIYFMTIIRNRPKENNRKFSEITDSEGLPFRCRNSQNAKVNTCRFHCLKHGLSLSQVFPPFLSIVGALISERIVASFRGHVACHFNPLEGLWYVHVSQLPHCDVVFFFFFFFNFLAHGLHIHLVVVIFIQMYSPKEFFNNKDRDSIPWHDSVGLSYKISRK